MSEWKWYDNIAVILLVIGIAITWFMAFILAIIGKIYEKLKPRRS
jgi:hypothetical protein